MTRLLRRGMVLSGITVATLFAIGCGKGMSRSATEEWRDVELRQAIQVAPDLEISAIAADVWLHTSWYTYPGGTRVPSNGLLVREGDHLLLIDTAWGEVLTERLLEWIEIQLELPVAAAIITHSHHDRIAGMAALERRNIEVLAHPLTRRLAAEHGLPIPDTIAGISTPGGLATLGTAEVFFPGAGHTRDNIMVWLPDHLILFGGCAVRSASTSTLGNTAHADTAAWPNAIERALRRYGDASQVVPGHGAVGGPELLEHTLSLFAH